LKGRNPKKIDKALKSDNHDGLDRLISGCRHKYNLEIICMTFSKLIAVGGVMTLAFAGVAFAECTIEGGGRAGVLQNNDLLSFGHDLSGASAQYKGSYTDTSWAGSDLTVAPVGSCQVINYPSSGGHARITEATMIGNDSFGIGCQCPS